MDKEEKKEKEPGLLTSSPHVSLCVLFYSHFFLLSCPCAAFPSMAKPGQPIKLPGQTRVAPDEYVVISTLLSLSPVFSLRSEKTRRLSIDAAK